MRRRGWYGSNSLGGLSRKMSHEFEIWSWTPIHVVKIWKAIKSRCLLVEFNSTLHFLFTISLSSEDSPRKQPIWTTWCSTCLIKRRRFVETRTWNNWPISPPKSSIYSCRCVMLDIVQQHVSQSAWFTTPSRNVNCTKSSSFGGGENQTHPWNKSKQKAHTLVLFSPKSVFYFLNSCTDLTVRSNSSGSKRK